MNRVLSKTTTKLFKLPKSGPNQRFISNQELFDKRGAIVGGTIGAIIGIGTCYFEHKNNFHTTKTSVGKTLLAMPIFIGFGAITCMLPLGYSLAFNVPVFIGAYLLRELPKK